MASGSSRAESFRQRTRKRASIATLAKGPVGNRMEADKTRPVHQPAGNWYPKYTTKNPIAKTLVAGFLDQFFRFVEMSGARNLHEIGCGEGELSWRAAAKGSVVRGTDVAEEAIALAKARVATSASDVARKPDFRVAGICDLSAPDDCAELVICCEVLEHLEDPEQGLAILHRLASPWLLTSVPREPIWRVLNVLRGKYLGSLGNSPGHIQHWSRASFRAFIERRFDVVELASPFPWTMILAKRRETPG